MTDVHRAAGTDEESATPSSARRGLDHVLDLSRALTEELMRLTSRPGDGDAVRIARALALDVVELLESAARGR